MPQRVGLLQGQEDVSSRLPERLCDLPHAWSTKQLRTGAELQHRTRDEGEDVRLSVEKGTARKHDLSRRMGSDGDRI